MTCSVRYSQFHYQNFREQMTKTLMIMKGGSGIKIGRDMLALFG